MISRRSPKPSPKKNPPRLSLGPSPADSPGRVSLELGGGGLLMREFLKKHILPSFRSPLLKDLPDAAHVRRETALTTDGYVVDPIFFPGGDIGMLCVNGSVNDLVVSGAVPEFLSVSMILEEGLPEEDLKKILISISRASSRAGVQVVTGDTKVVHRGQADKLYIVTSGVGRVVARADPRRIRPGDAVIVTGTLGEHSLAVLLARGDFSLKSSVKSDCAPLVFLLPLWRQGVLWMRDITRGGLATNLHELTETLPYSVVIEEERIPLSRPVRGACELLGIDPLYLACEGRAILIVSRSRAAAVLNSLRRHPLGRRAAVVGRVEKTRGRPGELLLATLAGGLRKLEPLTSELLPRIC
ncbi:MAG: hydrogenase expression/formation protein HypE [Candidatus Aminicenantes bacterium]|nr:hydrogenase expression/formation protein HypE [Candidatus Aminicenantes bacterium]